MRLLMLISVVALTVALLGATGVINGVSVLAWLCGGLLAWAVDVAVGGWVLPVAGWRQQPPR